MSLPGITPRTQSEVVEEALNNSQKVHVETLKLPGITTLHTKPTDEVAAVLANLLKSRTGIISLKFVVGSHVELTYNDNPFNQVR